MKQLMNRLYQYGQCAANLTLQQPKEVGFMAFLVLFIVMAIYKSTPAIVDKNFELKIYKNRTPITNLMQERDVINTKVVWIDRLMLKDGARLKHPKLGVIGFGDSFFIDVESKFTVRKAGVYYFIPGSDDGFSLDVDGVRLCAFEGDHPYSTQRCEIKLNEGVHSFKLSYFQGGGFAGLTLAYQFKDDGKQRWFGDSSQYLRF
jgi:hypothetical protein